ncbi:restriction endonuclease subunit S [Bacillus sp. NPDC057893]|uniref:restriction endonuclease subunit S n=1 Tax=Bacillus sp. NPDC057893 TaxID=3346273 RepID=UPI00366E9365
MKLGEVLSLAKNNIVHIEDNLKYVIAGVQTYGKGIVNKREVFGKDLTMKKYQLIEQNQLMWCKVDTKNGGFGVTKKEHVGSLASSNMALANINLEKSNPEFIQLLFRNDYFIEYINKLSSGTTNRKYLKAKDVLSVIEIPEMTLNEQNLFIKRYNALFNKYQQIEEELSNQKTYIDILKKQILQNAISGTLVNQDDNDEPAIKFLEKIMQETFKSNKNPNQKIKISEEEKAFKLPKGWAWCKLGQISNISSGSTPLKSNPFYYENGNIGWCTSSVTGEEFVYQPNNYITELAVKECNLKLYPPGTLVMAMYGQGKTRGQTTELLIETTLNQACAGIELLNKSDVHKDYVKICLKETYSKIRDKAVGGNQPNLNGSKIKNILIPLPPLNEQKRISEKVNELMEICGDLEQGIEHSLKENKKLMKAVLQEAFTVKEEVLN